LLQGESLWFLGEPPSLQSQPPWIQSDPLGFRVSFTTPK
jgi:hypothetical protein